MYIITCYICSAKDPEFECDNCEKNMCKSCKTKCKICHFFVSCASCYEDHKEKCINELVYKINTLF